MKKVRIIIADIEYSYIAPLQIQFGKTFSDKIDLEVITDIEYFETLFSMPQVVDILIISKEFYSQKISRHNIGKLFMMTEDDTEGNTADLAFCKLKKYTSLSEIFEQILEESKEILIKDQENQEETKIITVYSACGGTGKTMLAMGLSACLAKSYKRVLYINAGRIQSFQHLLRIQNPISDMDFHIKVTQIHNPYDSVKSFIRKEGFYYIPPFRNTIMSMGISYRIFEQIAETAKKTKEYDYIIVDADTAFDEDKAALLQASDKVILVTRPDRLSIQGTNILIQNINDIHSDKYMCICNDVMGELESDIKTKNLISKLKISESIGKFRLAEENYIDNLAKMQEIKRVATLLS